MASSGLFEQGYLRAQPENISNTDRQDGANTQHSHFCFRQLPLELREEVYKHALEPRAEFRVGNRRSVPSSFELPTMQFWAPPGEDANDDGLDMEQRNIDPNSHLRNYDNDGMLDLVQIMSFQLSISAPLLLLVSKDIHSEVTRLLDNLRKLLAAQIYLQRIKEPTEVFLDIASRSRFAVTNGPIETLFLVKHLPDSVKPLVKEMAFTLQTWDDAGPLWGTIGGRIDSEVTKALCSELPNLRTIAMQVPGQDGEHDFWTAAPLYYFHQLLQSKRIDTVRLFYRVNSDGGGDEGVYEHDFGPRNDAADPDEIPSWLRGSSYIETRQRAFDIVEVPSWTQWMSEPRFLEKQMMARTIEITRWEDTKLGSKTYKHLVEIFD